MRLSSGESAISRKPSVSLRGRGELLRVHFAQCRPYSVLDDQSERMYGGGAHRSNGLAFLSPWGAERALRPGASPFRRSLPCRLTAPWTLTAPV